MSFFLNIIIVYEAIVRMFGFLFWGVLGLLFVGWVYLEWKHSKEAK